MKHWSTIAPLLAAALLGVAAVVPGSTLVLVVSGLALMGAVLAVTTPRSWLTGGRATRTLVLALA